MFLNPFWDIQILDRDCDCPWICWLSCNRLIDVDNNHSKSGVGKLQPASHKWHISKFLVAHLSLIKISILQNFLCCAVKNWGYNRILNSECGRNFGQGSLLIDQYPVVTSVAKIPLTVFASTYIIKNQFRSKLNRQHFCELLMMSCKHFKTDYDAIITSSLVFHFLHQVIFV